LDVRTNVVLIDYENVQPKDIGLLKDGSFKVKVFLGPNQAKIPLPMAIALQPLGENVEYIQIDTAGNNALDFHIAYYIGVLSREEPRPFFHIISKDTGFDPLLKHLKKKKIFAKRYDCIAYIKCLKPKPEDPVDAVIEDLVRRKASKPRTQKTLISTMHAILKEYNLSDQQEKSIFEDLCDRGIVKLDGTKVSYALPTES
jgi:hypothetical protein